MLFSPDMFKLEEPDKQADEEEKEDPEKVLIKNIRGFTWSNNYEFLYKLCRGNILAWSDVNSRWV